MKNKKLVVTLATLATAGGMLVGCKDKGGEATVESVAIKGISMSYSIEDTIAWDNLTVSVTYSDKTVASFTKVEFDVETTAADTECIVLTSGLHDKTTLELGSYDIKVSLKEDFTKFYDAGKITVGAAITSAKYELMEFAAPEFVTSYAENIKTANFTDEASFVKNDELFTVGTLNEFKFVPSASFDSIDGDETDVISNKYEKEIEVKEIGEGTTVEASSSDYKVTENGFKFEESAIGKKFEVKVSPKEFKKDFAGADVNPVTFSFKVEKGLNIYSAKELGALNLTSIDPVTNGGNEYYDGLYATNDVGARVYSGANPIFWDSASSSYVEKNTVEMWKNYLKNTGTYSDAEMENLKDLPAIFLMNDIEITTNDIPSDFLITANESGNTLGEKAVGALRDSALLYFMPLNIDRNINGNYFNIDSSRIPLCMSESTGSSFHTWTERDPQIFAGHSVLFYFSGVRYREAEKDYRANQTLKEGLGVATIKNIRSKGNTTNNLEGDDFEKRLKITGLIFTKAGYAAANYDNLVLREYSIGIFANQNMGQANPALGIQQHDYHFVSNCKVFDCANSGLFSYENGGLHVSKSMLKRFGGAPIISVGSESDPLYQANTKFTSDCVLENKITGQEVYFAALGATSAVTTLKQLNAAFEPLGTPFVKEGLMNVLSLSMNGDYLASDKKAYYASTTLFADTEHPYTENLADLTLPTSQIYYATGYQAPTCSTEKGDFFFFGGQYLCNIDQSMKTTPVNGDYMTMFAPAGGTTLHILMGMK